jgi:hypothetical protein
MRWASKLLATLFLLCLTALCFNSQERKTGSLLWTVSASINYPAYFDMKIGNEYTISLRELANYSESIQSSPESSNSTLSISITQVDNKFKLISLETTPFQMEKWQGTYLGVTTFMFEKTITGSSVDDLSIHFKIVSPNYIDPTTIAIVFGVVAVTILGPVGLIIWKKRKTKATSLN